jgi:hypothetical protein
MAAKTRKSAESKPADTEGTDTPDKTPEGVQRAREAQHATEAEQGFLGDRGEALEGVAPVLPVSESAPEDVNTDPSAGVVIANGENFTFDPPATMADHKAPKLEGDQAQGYTGELPNADNREDLTLQAALTRLPQNQD